MRITLFIGGLSGGGAERVTCSLATYLVNKNHDVEILTVSDEAPAYPLDKRVTRYSLTGKLFRKGLLRNFLRIIRFILYLMRRKCDAYVVLLPRTTFMLLNMRFLTKSKIIAAQRIMPASLKPDVQKKLQKIAIKADAWVFQTKEQSDWFVPHIGESKTIVIPNAINPDFLNNVYNGDREKVIVSAGRMTKQKNQELLIKAFTAVHKDFPNYRLVIYGEGPFLQGLQETTKGLGLSKYISFPGYMTNVGQKIKNTSLFVLSSDYEGMPNALMEAMALGLPCVSTDCDGGGAKYLIENEKNGLLVPKGDVDALATAMEKMLSDRNFAECCGREAHKICERLAPEKIYGEWESFIKEIAENNKQ